MVERHIMARDIMTSPVYTVRPSDRVKRVVAGGGGVMYGQTAGRMIDFVAPAGQHEEAGATAATKTSAQHSAVKREEETMGTKTKAHGHMPSISKERRRDLYRL